MDMAKNLIRLAGLEPSRDVPVEVVGLRRGERLHEELLMEEEELHPSEHEKVLVVQNRSFDAEGFGRELSRLRQLVSVRDGGEALQQLKLMVGQHELAQSFPAPDLSARGASWWRP